MGVVVAVDAGTTGVRAVAVDEAGRLAGWAYRELRQHYPRPGWVEHDPDEISGAVGATLADLHAALAAQGTTVAAVGVTNQRETAVAWDRRTGRPRHPAIVWQDRRTAGRCDQLTDAGSLPLVREATGLVLDPYFTATKLEWMLAEGGVEADADLAVGTVDTWVVGHLTGGAAHVTDPSNASRTLLYDQRTAAWSPELCQLFGVPMDALAEVRPSSARYGLTTEGCGLPAGIPVSGIAGDQQAALFGQACLTPGMVKHTYGTGGFALLQVGEERPPIVDGLLTTVAWQLGEGCPATYAYEGAVFIMGAAVQWLRDELGLISSADEVEALARSVPDSGGVVVVPAFTGLGSPWWDPWARGTILGLTRGVGRGHLARAVLEAMAFSTRDVVEAMARSAGRPVLELRVDGGAAGNDLLLQLQADQLQVPVIRPVVTETTALGAAFLAGLAEGFWGTTADVAAAWAPERTFRPEVSAGSAAGPHQTWLRGVDRSRGWTRPG
ncbi:MAG: glycerol kinase GlpK [Acidimicrobiales bacterium]